MLPPELPFIWVYATLLVLHDLKNIPSMHLSSKKKKKKPLRQKKNNYNDRHIYFLYIYIKTMYVYRQNTYTVHILLSEN